MGADETSYRRVFAGRHQRPLKPKGSSSSDVALSSADQLLTDINEVAAAFSYAPFCIAAGVCFMFLGFALAPILAIPGLIATTLAIAIVPRYDRQRCSMVLEYELTGYAQSRLQMTSNLLFAAQTGSRTWLVHDRQNAYWKYHGGATSLVRRTVLSAQERTPPYVSTNVRVTCLSGPGFQLYFLPDFILLWHRRHYLRIPFQSITVDIGESRFREESQVPNDALVLEYVWLYPRKDGGPDLRFNGNRQIPVLHYGTLDVRLAPGNELALQTSTLAARDKLAAAFRAFSSPRPKEPHCAQQEQKPNEPRHGNRREEPHRQTIPPPSRPASTFMVLGLSSTASADEIVAAYRGLAQKYHPDKVIHLGPEFQALAEEKMKAINAAYAELERTVVAPRNTR